jgi:hypothetical protein
MALNAYNKPLKWTGHHPMKADEVEKFKTLLAAYEQALRL